MTDDTEAIHQTIESHPSDSTLGSLWPALEWLDQVLARAMTVAEATSGRRLGDDPYRGLYFSRRDADQMLASSPLEPAFHAQRESDGTEPPSQMKSSAGAAAPNSKRGPLSRLFDWLTGRRDSPVSDSGYASSSSKGASSHPSGMAQEMIIPALPDLALEGTRLGWLADTFELTLFDLEVLLIALGPELDLRYERLYGYLQDDVTRKWPTVDLMLNLLCPSAEEKLAYRAHFGSDGPLLRHRLISLTPAPGYIQPPLLGYSVQPESQVTRLLLGEEGLDTRLASFCQLIKPQTTFEDTFLAGPYKTTFARRAGQARAAGLPLRLYLQGPPGSNQESVAEALAEHLGMGLLRVDLQQALASDPNLERTVAVLFREAWFQDAVLFLDGFDTLRLEDRVPPYRSVLSALADDRGMTVLSGALPWSPPRNLSTGVTVVPVQGPDFDQRLSCWEENLRRLNISLEREQLYGLADRFRLTCEQIADAALAAENEILVRSAQDAGGHPADSETILQALFAAARLQSGHDLAGLAHKITPIYTLDDIVLPESLSDPDHTAEQLKEICQRVTHQHRVLDEWGFGRKLSYGKGTTALFAGPPGSGKTMAAEGIARALGLDLYRIDLAQVVSKYIGETEKNLDRIFVAASDSNAILFFDEADALFGKRSEVRDSHDRYANLEIAYLLQKMEEYEGLAILATNLRQNLDDAFIRRLAFIVHFPFPDEACRRRIWEKTWTREIRLGDDVNPAELARRFKVSGGSIKNIALASAFYAAQADEPVNMQHLLLAAQREYQKTGKPFVEYQNVTPTPMTMKTLHTA